MDSKLYTRIINIFENYFQIKYNKDIININRNGDNICIIYEAPMYLIPRFHKIKLYSLYAYCITKNYKYYENINNNKYNYYFFNYINYKHNKIEITSNRKIINTTNSYYNLQKIYYINYINIYYKNYYTSKYLINILCCEYIYNTYNLYIIYNRNKYRKLNHDNYIFNIYNIYNNYNYKIIFIIFGLIIISFLFLYIKKI